MKWFGGIEIDTEQMSGEDLCQKLAIEMYEHDEDERKSCDEPVRNAMYIIDFDGECSMEVFSTPCIGNITREQFLAVMNAFRAIGDDRDADILSEALSLDDHYSELLENGEPDEVYSKLCNKLNDLENRLYYNTDYDMWALLFDHLDKHIKQK